MITAKTKMFGLVLQSTGKYEPEHWFHVVISQDENGITTFTNNFNSCFITMEDLLQGGYKVVPPSDLYADLKEFIYDLDMAVKRWVEQ